MRNGKARKLDIRISADMTAMIHFNLKHLVRQPTAELGGSS